MQVLKFALDSSAGQVVSVEGWKGSKREGNKRKGAPSNEHHG